MSNEDDSMFEFKPPYQWSTEDVVKELENIYTQLRNMQSDFVHLGVIICGLLIAIIVVIWIKS